MAEPKRGSKEAFLAAEKRRKDRVKSKAKGFNIFNLSGVEKRRKENEAFNKKVRAKNEKARSENPSYAKFKASEERRMTRLANVNKNNKVISKKVQRRLDKKKNIVKKQANVEVDLPKSQLPVVAGKKAPLTGATTVATTVNIPPKNKQVKPIAKTPKDKKVDLSGFGAAFKKARAKGVGTKFAFNDKMYAAVTKDDVRSSGASNLTEFLNKAQRQESKIAKAPGQITEMKKEGGMMKDTLKRYTPEESKRLMQDPSRRERLKKLMESKEGRKKIEGKQEGGLTSSIENLKARLKQYREEEKRSPGIKMRREEQAESRSKKAENFGGRIKDRRQRRKAGPGAAAPRTPSPGRRPPMNPMPDRPKRDRTMTPLGGMAGAMAGAAASDREMMSMKRAIMKDERMDRMKAGGSVMARGCKMGRKKATKIY